MAYKKDKKVVGVPVPLVLYEKLNEDVKEDIIFNSVPKFIVKIINDYYQNKEKKEN